jgi:hypothetical protein
MQKDAKEEEDDAFGRWNACLRRKKGEEPND